MQLLPASAEEHWPEAVFPLHVAADKRYLVDAADKPFLIQGDAAWSLIAELKREEVEAYLEDRRKRGFNALLVNLIEHQFSSNPPANAYGDRPFEGGGGFTDMNRRYFDHAEWVLQRARDKGFLVLLTPAYLGANGSSQGWYLKAEAAGPEKLRRYGETIAKRFTGLGNIVWVHGGDYDVPDKTLVQAIVSGIESVAPNSLHTVHSRRDTVTADYWSGEEWLMLDTVYTYEDVHRAVLARTLQPRTMPVLMIEALYEGEHGTGEETVRRQAYGALLGGAAGHISGNHPIWHFSGPGIMPSPISWQDALDSPGARSMAHMRKLFESLDWWKLEPDANGDLVRSNGRDPGILAAVANDRSFALVYGDRADGFDVNMALFASKRVDMRWYDPSSGEFTTVRAESSGNESRVVPPHARNASGGTDWILVLRENR
ncbi:hypothetical protein C5748_20320 [Phyllobacterium phragmitis]|uniref:DUF4038 domain-containing protein n=2 Tax=Phyllobacterium phragmitis TaxID=2670329 RepID=A0A2S9IMI6_9HYPH|nr:hypothetical protein C5748_20320 [Phyllobacterium phragmitis]